MKKVLIFLFVVSFTIPLHAQNNDACLWLGLNIEKNITRSFIFNISQEVRMNENISELGSFLTDAGFTYKINKLFKISANYRFINKRQIDDFYSKRHRYYFDLTFRKKIKPFIMQFRTRFQSQYEDIYSSDNGFIPSNYSRNKLTLKLDLDKKFAPYINTEIYIPLNKKDNLIYIDNTRFSSGVEYEINRVHSFDIFYMIQKEFNVPKPETDFIIGINYNLHF